MRTNRFVRTAALAALVLTPAAVAQAGQRAVVEGLSQRLTVACGNAGAHVQGTGNTVTLTGTCTDVLVEGSNNTVHVATLGSLKVGGMGNKVYWSNGIDGATPKITKEGMGNTVERKAPADSPAPAPTASAAPKPAAGGTASATASTPSSGTTATASPGAPSMTVSKGGKTVGMGASAGGASMGATRRGEPAAAKPAPATTASTAAPPMGIGVPIVVGNNQQVKTIECEGRAVSVSGNGNKLTLKGQCGPISVGGNENILHVGATTRIDTSGNRNVVTYRELVDDKAPIVTSGGNGNRVSRAEPQ
jgi:hypothetical protein